MTKIHSRTLIHASKMTQIHSRTLIFYQNITDNVVIITYFSLSQHKNSPKNDIIIKFMHILVIFDTKLRVREWI